MSSEDLSKFVKGEDLAKAVVQITGCSNTCIIGDVEFMRATSGFEGFLSVTVKVKVSYCTNGDDTVRTKVLFVKCAPHEKVPLGMVQATKAFLREGAFFDKALPIMEQVSRGTLDIPLPRCFHAVYTGGQEDVLFFEDLTEGGYRTPKMSYLSDGLDLEHCSMVMRKLGELHALSLSAEKLLPSTKENWVEAFPIFGIESLYYVAKPGDPPIPFKGVADTGGEIVLEISKSLPGLPQDAEASGKLKVMVERSWKAICKLVKPSPKHINILTHGDCWLNNLMYRYETDVDGSERPVDLKFIDLQLARYCHPSTDILHFIYQSTRRPFRDRHIDDLIDEYYNSLEESLKILNYGPPPFLLEEFRSDFQNVFKPFGVYLVFGFTLLLVEGFAPSNVEDMTPEMYADVVNTGNISGIRRSLVNDPEYRAKVEECVKEYVDMLFPNGLNSMESSLFWSE